MSRFVLPFAFFTLFAVTAATADHGTHMLAEPTVSNTHVVFSFDNDLWIVGRDGGTARRLTSAAGRERNPRLSPDGRWLAFSATYAGQLDVYVMPATGGEARRLTWHPREDFVQGFTPDSRAVVFDSPRSVHTEMHRHLYSVNLEGGVPERLPIPTGYKAALSPDGRYVAYTPSSDAFGQWKRYRGGTAGRIWIMDLKDFDVVEVPKPPGGANDTDPMWIGDRLYFNSDRDGEFNLYSFDRASFEVERLTALEEFPVIAPAAAPDGLIVFEHAGLLHRLDTVAGEVRPLPVAAPSDLEETRPRRIRGSRWVRAVAPAPDLNRAAVEYRGEIFTLPAEKGDPRRLTHNSGTHSRSPVWSSDGRRVAWFSDRDDEYALYVAEQDGRSEPRRYALDGAGFYDRPVWSPDGRRIAYQDNSRSLWVIDLHDGRSTRIARDPVYGMVSPMRASWSGDSRWLAYTLQEHGLISTAYAWSVASGESIRLTDGMSETIEPVFDAGGEFLYLLASTNAGPLKDWFSQSSQDMRMSFGVYVITLRADGPHPLPPQSDEVGVAEGEVGDTGAGEPPRVRIDAEGIHDRITALPLDAAYRRQLRAGGSGEIYWLEGGRETGFGGLQGEGKLIRYALDRRKAETLGEGIRTFELSRKGDRILYERKNDWFINPVAGSLPANEGRLALDAIEMEIDPRAEWRQILGEAWRINRDYFYDPEFHGADWEAVREKYAAFLPHLATRHDLDRVIRWMLSELAVGHSHVQPGDYINEPEPRPAGLLGADFEVVDGRWRFARVYGGLSWDPVLRAPLRTPGVNVRAGEYLLAVEGRELRPPENVYAAFAGTVDRQVRITVANRPNGRDAREVTVVPIASETGLRYLDWRERNRRYVDERTGGRVAYVHVPDTATAGHEAFKRYFYPQSHKQALILDDRHNRGGAIADYYIDILRREYIAHWNMRYGADLVSPRAAIFGPKVMLADETSRSGGDLLPWMFQRFELGPVIGKRTWGGLVGALAVPSLLDGGVISAPNIAFWTESDGFALENEGVTPDIEVEQWPVEVNTGRDPQLDRAIEEVLRLLEEAPPQSRSGYSDRSP